MPRLIPRNRQAVLPLLLLLLVEAALLLAAALQPHWAALYIIAGAVVLYGFAVRFGNTRRRRLNGGR